MKRQEEMLKQPAGRHATEAWNFEAVERAIGGVVFWESSQASNWRRLKFLPLSVDDWLFLPVRLPDADHLLTEFREAFRQVWASIPVQDREEISRHWLDDESAERVDPWAPRIELVPEFFCSGQEGWSADAGIYAACRADGHVLVFCGDLLHDLSHRSIVAVVAHELAHVFQHATGRIDTFAFEDNGTFVYDYREALLIEEDDPRIFYQREAGAIDCRDYLGKEDDANQIIAGWGFAPDDLPG